MLPQNYVKYDNFLQKQIIYSYPTNVIITSKQYRMEI